MERNFTNLTKTIASVFFTVTTLLITGLTSDIYAQVSCNNETVLFLENFGTGTTSTSSSDILSPALVYQETGSLIGEGVYRVINNTQQKPEWQAAEDHTPNDVDGKMLVINGQAETFYRHQITRQQGFDPGNYTASFYIMNVDTLGICGANALLPNINIRVEYLSSTNTWVPLSGSPYEAPPVPQTSPSAPTWVPIGSSFTLPSTGNFTVTSIRIVVADGTVGGCGNDFAMDDIKFSLCPEGGPLPVQFVSVTARQRGSGVSIDWSTSQEINSRNFEIEKSADGNTDWTSISSVSAAGNSAVVKNYNAFDATPFNGVNFYRIKQVDIDGNAKYSKTVRVTLNLDRVGVSVLANPFRNILSVDFSSSTEQSVIARIIDMTGKQVVSEKWFITPGSTRKQFSNVNGLQQGMYILNISGNSGEILYNNKVIKQ